MPLTPRKADRRVHDRASRKKQQDQQEARENGAGKQAVQVAPVRTFRFPDHALEKPLPAGATDCLGIPDQHSMAHQLDGKNRRVLDDGEPHPPLLVFRKVNDRWQQRRAQQLDADHAVHRLQTRDDVQPNLFRKKKQGVFRRPTETNVNDEWWYETAPLPSQSKGPRLRTGRRNCRHDKYRHRQDRDRPRSTSRPKPNHNMRLKPPHQPPKYRTIGIPRGQTTASTTKSIEL